MSLCSHVGWCLGMARLSPSSGFLMLVKSEGYLFSTPLCYFSVAAMPDAGMGELVGGPQLKCCFFKCGWSPQYRTCAIRGWGG